MEIQLNEEIRAFMEERAAQAGQISSADLVSQTKLQFPEAQPEQIAGNLSALCCHYDALNYDDGVVSPKN